MISCLADKHNGQGVHSVMNTLASNDNHAKGATVRPVTSLFGQDTRLRLECARAFPDSPEFVSYLVRRLVACNGSLVVAQLFIAQFRVCFPETLACVSLEQVTRLGVDHVPSEVTTVFTELLTNGFPIMQALIRLEFNLNGDLHLAENEMVANASHKAIDLSHLTEFKHLFICASAMLAGVTADPRMQAA